MRKRQNWSPFKKNGKFSIVFYTDPLWKRMWARIRRQPLWHQMGAIADKAEEDK